MHPFLAQLLADWPYSRWQGHGVVVAVSGGADSVALLHALQALNARPAQLSQAGAFPAARLLVAHFHHGWREQADADQQFVAELARRLELPFVTQRGPGAVSDGGRGPEATARRLRYDFLLRTATSHAARYIVTAHTADDQAETILHRLLRGTGIAGLAGIPRVRRLTADVALVRPLLQRNRAEICQYLSDSHESFCTDPSNRDPRYMRNRIRHVLLPLLREQFQSHVDEALLRLADDAREYSQTVQSLLRERMADVIGSEPAAVRIERHRFAQLTPLLQTLLLREVWQQQGWPLRDMTRRHWLTLAALIADSPATARQFPGAVTLRIESTQTAQLSRS